MAAATMQNLSALALLVLLGGCASPMAPGAEATPEDEKEGPAVGSSAVVVPGTARPGREGGSIVGTVHDEAGAPLDRVTVGLVSLAREAETDGTGEFVFDGIEPGPYILRAQKDGYQSVATPLEVVAGGRTNVQVVLAPANVSVLADFWQGRDRAVVADASFAGADTVYASECVSYYSSHGDRWDGPPELRFDDPHQLVWPGTAAMEVVLDWTEESYSGDEMMLIWKHHPDAEWSLSPMTPKGETIRFAVLPEEADSPHQRFTAWRFAVCTKDQGQGPDNHLRVFSGEVHATVTLVRGHPLPVRQPETDLWADATRLLLVNETKAFSATDPVNDPTFATHGPCNGSTSRDPMPPAVEDQLGFSYTWRFDVFEGLLVPSGTARIEARLEWKYGAVAGAGPDLFLSFRGADVPPWARIDAALETVPEPVQEGPGVRVYSFAVDPAILDGADDPETAWSFYWNLDGPTPVCSGLEVKLVVEAVRGPPDA